MKRKDIDLLKDIAKVEPLTSRVVSRVPCLCIAVGHTGAGKSWKIVELIKRMQMERTITRLFIISPTAASNTIYKNIVREGDRVYDDLSPKIYASLEEIESVCKSEAYVYAHELKCAAAYLRYANGLPLDYPDTQLLEQIGWRQMIPKRPAFAVFADDCSHSALFSTSRKNPWSNFCLRCRHAGNGLGDSVFMVSQTMRSGVPKALRENATHFFYVGGSMNRKEVESMWETVSSFVSFDDFERKLRLFTLENHGYLFCDLIKKTLSNRY
ncbi:hypothetical protein JKP88DRAFT_249333 [Tribonema minus]|uniref:Uncharacterized protein n=1 Tax=Tribonema minus TaxID=303371 RepID=A0A835YL54_9STRA|nr:hypothetical protein JKP88DRAFT_249333 [Tribonema minus]